MTAGTEHPPNYPFPNDVVLWTAPSGNINPDSDSYTALARLPEGHTVEVNGREHRNTHRLVIHTPVRGPTAFLVQETDAESLISAGLILLGEYGSKHGGEGTAAVWEPYYNERLPVTVDFQSPNILEHAVVETLRAKRRAKHYDLDLTKRLHDLQRELEDELGEYGVVLAPEYNCEPGWEPQ